MPWKETCLAIASSLAIAAPALAQEATGTITGTLGLEPTVWYVTSAEGESLSGWEWDGNEVVVRLVGHVRRDTATATEGTLTVTFRTSGNPTELDVSAFTIALDPQGPEGEGPDYSAGPENADLDVEALVISEDEMALGGSFAGRLILGGAGRLVLDEDVPSVTVDGNFQATIPRLSDG